MSTNTTKLVWYITHNRVSLHTKMTAFFFFVFLSSDKIFSSSIDYVYNRVNASLYSSPHKTYATIRRNHQKKDYSLQRSIFIPKNISSLGGKVIAIIKFYCTHSCTPHLRHLRFYNKHISDYVYYPLIVVVCCMMSRISFHYHNESSPRASSSSSLVSFVDTFCDGPLVVVEESFPSPRDSSRLACLFLDNTSKTARALPHGKQQSRYTSLCILVHPTASHYPTRIEIIGWSKRPYTWLFRGFRCKQ